jgi:ParB/RepB/Spo0J family partition protein
MKAFCPVPGCGSRVEDGDGICRAHRIMARIDPDFVIGQLHPDLHAVEIELVKILKDLPAIPPAQTKGTMKARVKAEPMEIKKPGSIAVGKLSVSLDRKKEPAAKAAVTTPQPIHPLAGHSWTIEVEHGQMRGSETNPRKEFTEGALEELAASLKANGQLQACLVRPCPKWAEREMHNKKRPLPEARGLQLLAGKVNAETSHPAVLAMAKHLMQASETKFEIVAGERRWRACGSKYANLKKVLVTVRCLTDDQVIEAQYVENLQREDLTPLEEARGFRTLVETGKYSVDSLAAKFGKSRTHIFDRIKLTHLEGPALAALKDGRITATLAAVVATVPGKANQAMVMKQIVFDYDDQPRPVKDVQEDIEADFMRPLKGCGWELEQRFSYPGAVDTFCSTCPQMTRNMTAENPELAKGPARCMNIECFDKRRKAAAEILKAIYAKEGKEFWDEAAAANRRYRNEYCWEGDKCYDMDKSPLWEKVAKNMTAPIVAVTVDGIKRVWRRAELEALGVLKVAPSKTVEAKKAARKEELQEEKVFAKTKEFALVALSDRLGLPANDLSVLRDFVWRKVLTWMERGPHSMRRGGEIKFEDLTPEFMAKRMAKEVINDWMDDDDEDIPRCLAECKIDLKELREKARIELLPKKERAKLETQTKTAPGKPATATPPTRPALPPVNGHVRLTGHNPIVEAEPGALGKFLDGVADRDRDVEARP